MVRTGYLGYDHKGADGVYFHHGSIVLSYFCGGNSCVIRWTSLKGSCEVYFLRWQQPPDEGNELFRIVPSYFWCSASVSHSVAAIFGEEEHYKLGSFLECVCQSSLDTAYWTLQTKRTGYNNCATVYDAFNQFVSMREVISISIRL